MDVKEFEVNNYRFERVSNKSIPDLIKISESAFNISPSPEYYIQKNNTPNSGEPNLGFIAYSADGEPAAFYGVYAYKAELNGEIYSVAQSGDTMTHKNHTGKGLFTALAKATYQLCRENNISFVFGFPNYNSYPGFVKKLDWVCPDKLKEYRIKVFTVPVLKIVKKLPILKGLYNLRANFILSFYKPTKTFFQSSVIEPGVGGVYRNEAFVNYKTKNGSRLICVGGINVWIKLDGFLLLGDIDISDSEFSFDEFEKKLKKLSFLLGADVIQFLTTPNTKLDKIFSEKYIAKESLPYGFCLFDAAIQIEKFSFVFADSDTF